MLDRLKYLNLSSQKVANYDGYIRTQWETAKREKAIHGNRLYVFGVRTHVVVGFADFSTY